MTWIISKALMEDCSSLPSLPGEEVVFSGGRFSDGKPFAQLSVICTQHPFWLRDKTTDISRLSQFGLTYLRFDTTTAIAEVLLTACARWLGTLSSREDGLVRISQLPESEQESKGSGQDSGEKWSALYLKYDLDTCSWKTHQQLFEEDLHWSEVNLPNWGRLTSDGELWELTTLPDFTAENGAGSGQSWPTPNATDGKGVSQPIGRRPECDDDLPSRVNRIWPTPKAQEPGISAKTTGRPVEKSTHLSTQVGLNEGIVNADTGRKWATPQSRDQRARAVYHGRGKDRQTYPTPTSSMVTSADMEQARYAGSDPNRPSYQDAKKTWATPCAGDYRSPNLNPGNKGAANSTGIMPASEHALPAQAGGQLNSDWVEWLMGWPVGWTRLSPLPVMDWRTWDIDPADLPTDHPDYIPRVANGIDNRIDRLRAIGNGQVPLTAATAWRTLGGL